ncbi:hypothetical protein B0H10DRAFT_1363667 [Mycena sp. CBHHK59/15]|nr:hypothetical protein B0H10DRAFT_1363667 [Mycena sp. CBHHK59/15]
MHLRHILVIDVPLRSDPSSDLLRFPSVVSSSSLRPNDASISISHHPPDPGPRPRPSFHCAPKTRAQCLHQPAPGPVPGAFVPITLPAPGSYGWAFIFELSSTRAHRASWHPPACHGSHRAFWFLSQSRPSCSASAQSGKVGTCFGRTLPATHAFHVPDHSPCWARPAAMGPSFPCLWVRLGIIVSGLHPNPRAALCAPNYLPLVSRIQLGWQTCNTPSRRSLRHDMYLSDRHTTTTTSIRFTTNDPIRVTTAPLRIVFAFFWSCVALRCFCCCCVSSEVFLRCCYVRWSCCFLDRPNSRRELSLPPCLCTGAGSRSAYIHLIDSPSPS